MACMSCVMCLNGLPSSCTGTKLSDSFTTIPAERDTSISDLPDPVRSLGPDEIEEDEREDGELFESRRSSRTTQDDHIANYYLEKDVRGGRNASVNRSSRRRGTLTDAQSAGRKEAAQLFPLDPDAPCEWQGKNNCGGGTYPILGCTEGGQDARHHGPNKNTSFNEVGNVHRICHGCHNRWHLANDPDYDWNKADSYPPHSPVEMTIEDMKKAALRDMVSAAKKEAKNERRRTVD